MKRVISAILLVILLTSMLCSAFKIMPAEAAGTIYIRADGSIDPPTAPISTVDNVTYTFTGDVYDSIVVERNSIVVDGSGYTVQGTGASSSKGMDLTGRSNVTIKNTQIKVFDYGVWLLSSSDNSISGNTITNNEVGIMLFPSSNYNSISGNNIAANNWAGIELHDSSNISISGNNIAANNFDGIRLLSSSSNSVSGNNITANNEDGIRLYYFSNYNSISGNTITNSYSGIVLSSSSNYNSISGNNITENNGGGIYLYFSSNCSISGNNIANNGYGIWLDSSSNNRFYHNNFIDNTQQVQIYETGYANVWADGYPSGGNYWSDFNPADVFNGPYQNETGRDKIGDTPYVIDANNTDSYPLIYPYGYVPSPDFNNDGIIDIFDIVRMALAFGSVPGMPNWDPYVDLNQDGIIDIFDLVVVALRFGETV